MSELSSSNPVGPAIRSALRADVVLGTLADTAFVSVPQCLVRRPTTSDRTPPLPAMLAVGRGGADVRIRLYLWLFADHTARPSHPVARTSGEWAALLGLLPRPKVPRLRAQAARRVNTAINYLVDVGLLERAGINALRLLDPTGDGHAYTPWTSSDIGAREARRARLGRSGMDLRYSDVWEDAPLQVPVALWKVGAMSTLSAPAIGCLLVLLDHARHSDGIIWVPKSRNPQYCIKIDTWRKGTAELVTAGLIEQVTGDIVPGLQDRSGAPQHRTGWILGPVRVR